jgi:DNA-directed RNA polymerase subunit RPC12/RpoP
MEEPMRVRCLACGARLELPPRTTYATCRKCGSEYLVSRRGGAYALQALAPEELQLTKDVAAVEREGELGCANTALSMLAVVVVLFCVVGGVGQVVFNSRVVCFGAGLIALALVGVGAVVMLRNLERDRRRKERLLAAHAAPGDGAGPPREAAGPSGE